MYVSAMSEATKGLKVPLFIYVYIYIHICIIYIYICRLRRTYARMYRHTLCTTVAEDWLGGQDSGDGERESISVLLFCL